jgi:hypothetical protein
VNAKSAGLTSVPVCDWICAPLLFTVITRGAANHVRKGNRCGRRGCTDDWESAQRIRLLAQRGIDAQAELGAARRAITKPQYRAREVRRRCSAGIPSAGHVRRWCAQRHGLTRPRFD